ncbi:cytochrome o ubiquinol oxidase subunit IV [Acetobacter oeni]|uniref:Cytochrome bo(3) ubiquinol oxidase subunit 4 n=1 Tax=Acetobacter oeni TaxID=304077 RepID=A0A511XG77_9PROT|nr:cytochrome o ubiquinol oxidase subunit IV [Acetobacter oeni]MBB3882122.1 cytochrome o ubiquinol oxidase operon protein cyoD [Acetobacter oeni]NHO17885.1 cytochrome o ubiquinol oxidase subunit IV [Acetobacter oeni]GBR04168.1 cytochrome o ubiquinol oxidase subunit IV [Acetobacter oeni LMG 21952]GEN61956.1 cytochrome o ubiquinol oxidase subunit IV [Acetobacter oeni]
MSTDHSAHSESGHGGAGAYAIGFVLAVILTAASFMIVMGHSLSPSGTLMAISVLAAIQVVVHLIFFLHMNTTAEAKWNNNVFLFTLMFVAIFIVGTLFIMDNTAAHMMSR